MFQPFQQRRKRARIEAQHFTECLHGGGFLFPQGHHDQILRIGQADRVQQRLIGAGESVRRAVKGKAYLLVQPQQAFQIGVVALCAHCSAPKINREGNNQPCLSVPATWMRGEIS
ncbi:hypothetical protein D3C87_1626110 [compost metagenome]